MFVHAHPDDEALLTGGTIARLAAAGHRVVLVTATDGAAGLTTTSTQGDETLASVRAAELRESARVMGVSELVPLGYADSGLDGLGTPSTPGAGPCPAMPFAQVDVDAAALRIASLLRAQSADVVVGYDPAGGYGHPDHIQVSRVTRRAAAIAGTATLLEATMPREPQARAVSAAYRLRKIIPQLAGLDPQQWRSAYTPRADITYRVDVRSELAAKRAAMAAHVSQAAADDGTRTLRVLLRLPKWLFAKVMGTEWFAAVTLPADDRNPLPGILELNVL